MVTMGKKFYLKNVSIVVIIIIIISLAFFVIFEELKVKFTTLEIDNINYCTMDSDCIITSTKYCGDIIAINQKYIDRWREEKIAPTVIRTWCSTDSPLESDYLSICEDNKCKAVLR
jgi:hypothetical protein